jgi:hypothetical protein
VAQKGRRTAAAGLCGAQKRMTSWFGWGLTFGYFMLC